MGDTEFIRAAMNVGSNFYRFVYCSLNPKFLTYFSLAENEKPKNQDCEILPGKRKNYIMLWREILTGYEKFLT